MHWHYALMRFFSNRRCANVLDQTIRSYGTVERLNSRWQADRTVHVNQAICGLADYLFTLTHCAPDGTLPDRVNLQYAMPGAERSMRSKFPS
jgi:hypothetical protein